MTVGSSLQRRRKELSRVTREQESPTGRSVQITQFLSPYPGAQPYFTVTYFTKKGRPQEVRYTPFLDRAEFIFGRFLEDVTDPQGLRQPIPPFDPYRDRGEHPERMAESR